MDSFVPPWCCACCFPFGFWYQPLTFQLLLCLLDIHPGQALHWRWVQRPPSPKLKSSANPIKNSSKRKECVRCYVGTRIKGCIDDIMPLDTCSFFVDFFFCLSLKVKWGTWGCDAGSFPWSYGDNESCYLLEGKVTVTPTDGRKPATFGKGDFVTFPAGKLGLWTILNSCWMEGLTFFVLTGMSCQWDVAEPVKKHFKFF